ncbi:MAG: ATP-binding protein [bacterium]
MVPTNLHSLLDQYVSLAYHGLRARDKEFNITIEKDYDAEIDTINIIPQDISRVILNIVNNACYAANKKQKEIADGSFTPILNVSTKNRNDTVEIRIRDNGNGIPKTVRENLFNPFFTTKPTGEGTGLGLSISYDIIVKGHSGDIRFESEEGEYTEFIITLPK